MKYHIQSMVNSIINDKSAEAGLDLHQYLTQKIREASGLTEAKQSLDHTKRTVQRKDQDTYFGDKGERFDPANPRHQDEKDRRDAIAKAARAQHANYNPKNYPIADHEFKTRLFDPELVKAVKADHKGWHKMSELDQIEAQLWHMAPPPRRGVDPKDEAEAISKRALKLQSQIKRPVKEDLDESKFDETQLRAEIDDINDHLKSEGPKECRLKSFDLDPSKKLIVWITQGTLSPELKKEGTNVISDWLEEAGYGGWTVKLKSRFDEAGPKIKSSGKMDEVHFGLESRKNARKVELALKSAEINFSKNSNFGITYFNFDTKSDMRKAVKLANEVIDKSEESEW